MISGVLHSESPFRNNFTAAISNNIECSSPNVENLYIVRKDIQDESLFNAVKEFYNSKELSLRSCLMDWLENTGILNQVNECNNSTDSQTSNNREDNDWSLIINDTNQPLDKILGVKESARTEPESNLVSISCWNFVKVVGFCICTILFSALGYTLLIWLGNPENVDFFPLSCLYFVLQGFFCSLGCFLVSYIWFGKLITCPFPNNPSVAKFFAKNMRIRSDEFTTPLDSFIIVSQKIFTISSVRYTMTFTKLLLLEADFVWYISIQPKLPKELSAKKASVFTIKVD